MPKHPNAVVLSKLNYLAELKLTLDKESGDISNLTWQEKNYLAFPATQF